MQRCGEQWKTFRRKCWNGELGSIQTIHSTSTMNGHFSLTFSVWIFSTKINLGVGKILSYKLKLKIILQEYISRTFSTLVIYIFFFFYNKRDPRLFEHRINIYGKCILPVHLFRGRILILLFQVLLLRY